MAKQKRHPIADRFSDCVIVKIKRFGQVLSAVTSSEVTP
jgi:hypothetical protein